MRTDVAKQTERNQGYQKNYVLKEKGRKEVEMFMMKLQDSGENSQSKIHEEARARQFSKRIEKLCLMRRRFITSNETEDEDKRMQINL